MSQEFGKERVKELVSKLCDDRISTDEVAELESTLATVQEARNLYHLMVAVHRDLGACDITSTPSGSASGEHEETAHVSPASATSPAWLTRRRLSIVASLAAVLLLMAGYAYFQSTGPSCATVPVATVTDLVDVNWPNDGKQLEIGDQVETDRVRLDSGTVCFTYTHGVVITIDGPAELDFVSRDHLFLHQGTLVAYVPHGAEGFRVSTNRADVVDLGTEFGVTATEDGTSNVIVFDGEVELSTSGSPNAPPQSITAGLAWQVDHKGIARQQEFRPSGFEQSRTILHERRVIREAFRNEKSFPGSKRLGWSGPWSLDVTNLVIDDVETGIHTEKPLFPGTRNYLTINATAGQGHSKSILKLSREFESFGQFDLSQPYTIEFAIRIESDPSSIRQIRIAGAPSPATSNDDGLWLVRTSSDPGATTELSWRLFHGDDTGSHFETLPIVRGQSYRFMIEVDPEKYQWRMSISDGTRTIRNTRRGGTPLPLGTLAEVKNVSMRWEVASDSDADLRFSLDAIRIQNSPTPLP